jgi:hypothetical protein
MKNGIPGPIDLGLGIFLVKNCGEKLFQCSSFKGGKMTSSNRKEIEEVFVIQTDAIDFLGALVKEKAGKSVVDGRILFQDGTRWSFHSPAGERAVLSNKLLTLCEVIAGFYGTDVFRQKFDSAAGYEKFIGSLREAKYSLN